MQKEILVMEVKQTEDGKAFTVKDNESTRYFCMDMNLLTQVKAGGLISISYEHKMGKSGKEYNLLTSATKKGQPVAPQAPQTTSASKQVEVSGPEKGMACKVVADL